MPKLWDKARIFMGFLEEDSIEATPDFYKKNMPKKPLVNFTLTNGKTTGGGEVRVIEPKNPDQSLDIANALREGIPVIINLRHLDTDEAKRLFDFVCGTAYAIDGHFRKLGDNILLFTPSHINISDGDMDKQDNESNLEKERLIMAGR